MLSLRGVARSYGGHAALHPTDLDTPPGRTTVLIGPSGCGKTTLLRIMLGLVTPDAGEVRLDGELLTPANALRIRRQLGYVIQEGGLFPHLTAAGNAALLVRHLGWPRARIEARLAELARLTHLEPAMLERYPGELSGGQRQRVALMRALMPDPEVLLLDEPLGALDPVIRYDLQEELRGIFDALHKTVVLVTHDLAEAAFFGHRLHLMRAGRILQSGTLRELAAAPTDPFVTRFLAARRALPGHLLREAT
jgi:osmoprotectant transport system ATP-binding protein